MRMSHIPNGAQMRSIVGAQRFTRKTRHSKENLVIDLFKDLENGEEDPDELFFAKAQFTARNDMDLNFGINEDTDDESDDGMVKEDAGTELDTGIIIDKDKIVELLVMKKHKA